MKRYIREVFIPEYANNFNKELSASDIKFYGKIHFDRSRSDNELNMHCHLIVSRKDHANKKKLSPLTNHKNTKKGTVTGGFDRVNLFRQAELGFDKLFDYNRQQTESFDYHNMMKNSSTVEQLKLQEKCIQSDKRKIEINQVSNQEYLLSINLENKKTIKQSFDTGNNQTVDSFISFVSSGIDISFNPEDYYFKPKKQKRKRRKI